MTYTIIALIVYFLFIEIRKCPSRLLAIQLFVLFSVCCVAVLLNNNIMWGLCASLIAYYIWFIHPSYKQFIYTDLRDAYISKGIDNNFVVSGKKSLSSSMIANFLSVIFAIFWIWFCKKYPDTLLPSIDKTGVILFCKCFALYSFFECWIFSFAQWRAYNTYLKEIIDIENEN